jgi:hypothetical protein
LTWKNSSCPLGLRILPRLIDTLISRVKIAPTVDLTIAKAAAHRVGISPVAPSPGADGQTMPDVATADPRRAHKKGPCRKPNPFRLCR